MDYSNVKGTRFSLYWECPQLEFVFCKLPDCVVYFTILLRRMRKVRESEMKRIEISYDLLDTRHCASCIILFNIDDNPVR